MTAAQGYPPSDMPTNENAQDWVQNRSDVRALLNYIGIQKAYVISFNMIGFILLFLFIRHPDHITDLVAASTGSGAKPSTRNAFIQKTLNASERIINEVSFPTTIWHMLENVFN